MRVNRLRALGSLLVLLGFPSGTMAADLRVLGNVLSPAYLAMKFAVVCARQDPAFLSGTGGPRGSALVYAQHIKDEVIENLAVREAELIVLHAANAARAVALGFMRSMAGGSDETEAERVRDWCEGIAKPFIQGVVAEHEKRHDFFEEVLRAAKRQ